jgi:hypothetical protein
MHTIGLEVIDGTEPLALKIHHRETDEVNPVSLIIGCLWEVGAVKPHLGPIELFGLLALLDLKTQ